MSVSEVRGFVTNFVSDNFWIITNEAWGGRTDGSFAALLSEAAKQVWTNAMSDSNLFVEPRQLTLFPLSVIRVSHSLVSPEFFLVPPSGITPELLESSVPPDNLTADVFPPFINSNLKPQPVAAWLGVWGPNLETARRVRAAVLGAVALLPHPMERYLFTGRTLACGRCTLIKGSYQYSIGDPHTPALGEDVTLSNADQGWFSIVAAKLASSAKADRKHLRALEYQYRSWVPDPTRRFPTLFAALDAIYGDAGQATQAIIKAVGPVMGSGYDYDRLKLLLSLRASVIHGGAPNVFESTSYHRYYERYFTDPIRDLEVIVARCLQIEIFCGAMHERPHTYAELIRRETGRVL